MPAACASIERTRAVSNIQCVIRQWGAVAETSWSPEKTNTVAVIRARANEIARVARMVRMIILAQNQARTPRTKRTSPVLSPAWRANFAVCPNFPS